ncbi:MAG: DNA topoisomerase IV subunit A, partial [Proteobacteria bacterium]|nr:DNA topoisomerase IV subunit A [Pseudomonadota bacterium]
DGRENYTYIKRFRTPKFIVNREYRLFPEHKRSVIQMLAVGETGIRARISLVPSSRARYNSLEIDLDDYQIKGAGAKGKRAGNRVVRRVTNITGKSPARKTTAPSLPGFTPPKKGGGS